MLMAINWDRSCKMINKKIEDSQPKQPLTKAQKGKVVAMILAAAKIANKSKPKPKGKE
jgi:hypothetical protein